MCILSLYRMCVCGVDAREWSATYHTAVRQGTCVQACTCVSPIVRPCRAAREASGRTTRCALPAVSSATLRVGYEAHNTTDVLLHLHGSRLQETRSQSPSPVGAADGKLKSLRERHKQLQHHIDAAVVATREAASRFVEAAEEHPSLEAEPEEPRQQTRTFRSLRDRAYAKRAPPGNVAVTAASPQTRSPNAQQAQRGGRRAGDAYASGSLGHITTARPKEKKSAAATSTATAPGGGDPSRHRVAATVLASSPAAIDQLASCPAANAKQGASFSGFGTGVSPAAAAAAATPAASSSVGTDLQLRHQQALKSLRGLNAQVAASVAAAQYAEAGRLQVRFSY